LFSRAQKALSSDGPVAIVTRRVMAEGIKGLEGSPDAHACVPRDIAVEYLRVRGHSDAVRMLESAEKVVVGVPGVKCRDEFGKIVCDILKRRPAARKKVLVLDNDLKGSTGLHHIEKCVPGRFLMGGVMERNNFSVAAGFGSIEGCQGVFSTFSVFLEMLVSEISMARLNGANVLAHFSHAGVDWIADNTCHYGINVFFADNGFEDDGTRLYFPADADQMRAVLERVFDDEGLRFVFSTRSPTPLLERYSKGYSFRPGKDEILMKGEGYIVTYGDMVYRCLEAAKRLRAAGFDVGVINKPTLNVVDETVMRLAGSSRFVLVVESQGFKTGLGIRYGGWLLSRGFNPVYDHMGVSKTGLGGIEEHIPHQGLDVDDIVARVRRMLV